MSANTEERLTLIEARLSRMENHLGIATPKPAAATFDGPWAQAEPLSVKQSPPPVPHVEKPGNWLGLVAVICFVLAAGFIVKLSIESGWLTPSRQIGLAALLGLGLIATGFALMKSDREYASLLPGAGVIVLYLTAFAAHRYYALVSFELAIMLVSVVSGLCVWLYREIKHDIYAVTAAAGAYLSPVILGRVDIHLSHR